LRLEAEGVHDCGPGISDERLSFNGAEV
jgi:hypothetical protein